MKKLLFIYNPRSGKEQVKKNLSDILDTFAKAEMDITVRPTQCAKDCIEIIENRGEEFDLVVASGGDGTLNEAFNGLMALEPEKRPKFGYIPAGSTNDFATTLGISKNPVEAAFGAVNGKEFMCDVGKATTGYFAYVCAFGIFTQVSYATPQETKNLLGHTAYILEGIKSLTNIQDYHLKVTYEDEDGCEQVIEDDFLYGMVSNTSFVGGMNLLKQSEIDLQDGLFEVLLIKKLRNPLELQQAINALLTKNFSKNQFYFFKSPKVSISSDEEVAWTLDGENGGLVKDMVVENVPSAITMKCESKEK